MEVIDLEFEAADLRSWLRDTIKALDKSPISNKLWTESSAYDSWRLFLSDCAKECSPDTQKAVAVSSINSPDTAARLVLDGVPPERIIAMFMLIFSKDLER